MPAYCTTCRRLLASALCAGCGGKIREDEGARCKLVFLSPFGYASVHTHATDCCDERAAKRAGKGKPLSATAS